jgi:hypothetical protein
MVNAEKLRYEKLRYENAMREALSASQHFSISAFTVNIAAEE